MIKKRLIGVVIVKNGWAVQSFGYHRYLPLGKPECLVENLDRWGADEILIQVIDRSSKNSGPDFELLRRIARLGLGTPLIYGGGIRTIEDGVEVIQSGADRLTVDTLLFEDIGVVAGISSRLGSQALIASIPLSIDSNKLMWYNYRKKIKNEGFERLEETIQNRIVSEILLIDWKHEGYPNQFNSSIINYFPFKTLPFIAFGGISQSSQINDLLIRSNISAVAIGNFLSYREHAIQQLKDELANAVIRPSTYMREVSI